MTAQSSDLVVEIRGILKAYERLNSSSSEFATSTFGEIDVGDGMQPIVEKWLSSLLRKADVLSMNIVENVEEELQAAFTPWMFSFLGVCRNDDHCVDYSRSVFADRSHACMGESEEDYFRKQASFLIDMILFETKPEEVRRVTWKLNYRNSKATIDPYMHENWCAFTFTNPERSYLLAMYSILN